jgi:hypothetical protein
MDAPDWMTESIRNAALWLAEAHDIPLTSVHMMLIDSTYEIKQP